MKTINVGTTRPYDIHIGKGILDRTGNRIAAISKQSYQRIAVITDDIVGRLYGDMVSHSLSSAGFSVHTYVFTHGETAKNIHTVMGILSFLSDNQFTRSDLVVALGGGVVGDIAGFAASIYMRGIDYAQIPTTFLSAIDSSVGGKTGINIPQAKNQVGTFWQPRLVICDVSTLSTLEPETFLDGVAEAIKYGCIQDPKLFEEIAQEDVHQNIIGVISRCVSIKAHVVEEDEREQGLRQILNFGHTAGHAVEKLSDFQVSHGKGVGIGMVLAAAAGEAIGITKAGTAQRIRSVLERYKMATDSPFDAQALAQVCLRDKKRHADAVNFVLLKELGQTVIHPVPTNELVQFLQSGFEKK